MSSAPPVALKTPSEGCSSCSQIAARIALLEYEAEGLSAAHEKARLQLAAASSAYDTAKHLAEVAETRLARNRYKQMVLHGECNSRGC